MLLRKALYKNPCVVFSIIATISTQTLLPAPGCLAASHNQERSELNNFYNAFFLAHNAVPTQLGRIDETFRGSSGKAILFIQDAHDSLEAQENIAKLIDRFVKRNGVKTVFEEGYEGAVPTDQFFGFIKDPKIKQKVSYFLLDKLRVGGAEYAHINRSRDFELIGIDNLKLYSENIQAYQSASKNEEVIEADLQELFSNISILAHRYFPKDLKTWLRSKERFSRGELPLLSHLKALQLLYLKSAGNSRQFLREYRALSILLTAETSQDPMLIKQLNELDSKVVFEEMLGLEQQLSDVFLKNDRDRKIFDYYQGLSLLKRLNQIQLTQSEYDAAREILKKFKTRELADFIVSLTRKSLLLSKAWEQHITNSAQFYRVAQLRDQFIDRYLQEFAKNKREDTAVLVFGGFHAAAIKERLKAHGLSYVLISPKITAADERHQNYYKRLMSGEKHSFERPFLAAHANRPPSNFYLARMMGDAAIKKELWAVASSINAYDRDIDVRLPNLSPLPLSVHLPFRSEIRAFDDEELRQMLQYMEYFHELDTAQSAWARVQQLPVEALQMLESSVSAFDDIDCHEAGILNEMVVHFARHGVFSGVQEVLALKVLKERLDAGTLRQLVPLLASGSQVALLIFMFNQNIDWGDSQVAKVALDMMNTYPDLISKIFNGNRQLVRKAMPWIKSRQLMKQIISSFEWDSGIFEWSEMILANEEESGPVGLIGNEKLSMEFRVGVAEQLLDGTYFSSHSFSQSAGRRFQDSDLAPRIPSFVAAVLNERNSPSLRLTSMWILSRLKAVQEICKLKSSFPSVWFQVWGKHPETKQSWNKKERVLEALANLGAYEELLDLKDALDRRGPWEWTKDEQELNRKLEALLPLAKSLDRVLPVGPDEIASSLDPVDLFIQLIAAGQFSEAKNVVVRHEALGIQALGHPDRRIRARAADYLVFAEIDSAVPELMKRLNPSGSRVDDKAVETAVVHFKHRGVAPLILDRLQQFDRANDSPAVMASWIRLAGEVGEPLLLDYIQTFKGEYPAWDFNSGFGTDGGDDWDIANLIERQGHNKNQWHLVQEAVKGASRRKFRSEMRAESKEDSLQERHEKILKLLLKAAEARPGLYPFAKVAAGFVSSQEKQSDVIGLNTDGAHEHAEMNLILDVLGHAAARLTVETDRHTYLKDLGKIRRLIESEKLGDSEANLALFRTLLKQAGHPFKGGTFYATLLPCKGCQMILGELGLQEVVYAETHPDPVKAQEWQRQISAFGGKAGVRVTRVDISNQPWQPNRLFARIVQRSPNGHAEFQKRYLKARNGTAERERQKFFSAAHAVMEQSRYHIVDVIAFLGRIPDEDANHLFDFLFSRRASDLQPRLLEKYSQTEGYDSYLAALQAAHHVGWPSDREDPLTWMERRQLEHLYENLDSDSSLATAENLALVLRDLVKVWVTAEAGDGYDYNLEAINTWRLNHAARNEAAFQTMQKIFSLNPQAFTFANRQILQEPSRRIWDGGGSRNAGGYEEVFKRASAEALALFDQVLQSEFSLRSELRIFERDERQEIDRQLQVVINYLAAREKYVPGAEIPISDQWIPARLDKKTLGGAKNILVMMLGSWDERMAYEAAARIKELQAQGIRVQVLTSGKYGNKPGTYYDDHGNRLPEAIHYRNILRKHGIKVRFSEAKSTDTGKNIQYSKKMIDRASFHPDTILVMQTPILQRRSGLSIVRQYFGPQSEADAKSTFDQAGIQLINYSPYIPNISEGTDEEVFQDLEYSLREIKSLQEYPAKGFTISTVIPDEVAKAAFDLTQFKEKIDQRLESKAKEVELLTDLSQVRNRLREKWADVRWRHNRLPKKSFIPEPVYNWKSDSFLKKGEHPYVLKNSQGVGMDPNPPDGQNGIRTNWIFGDYPEASQVIFDLDIDGESARLLVAGDAQLPYESLLFLNRDTHLVLNDAQANYALLKFHRRTGLKGYVNSWGLGSFPRLHDHVVEDLPIFSLPLRPTGAAVNGFQVQELADYAASTIAITGDDDKKLAEVMALTAAELLREKIPHHVFLEAEKVIFVLRNGDPAKRSQIEAQSFDNRYLTSLFVGGVIAYPKIVLNRISPEQFQLIMQAVSQPISVRNHVISSLADQKNHRSELRAVEIKDGFFVPGERDARTVLVQVYPADLGPVYTTPYTEYFRPVYRDVQDYLNAKGITDAQERAIIHNPKQSIVIGIPTADLHGAVSARIEHFEKIHRAIEVLHEKYPEWPVELVININGLGQEVYLAAAREFQRKYLPKKIPITVLYMPLGGRLPGERLSGKSNPMNAIVDYAKRKNATILGMMDDDVGFGENNILSNVEFLIRKAREMNSPVHTGSRSDLDIKTRFGRMLWPDRIGSSRFVRGTSMFDFIFAMPPLPSFPINEDLYLLLYYKDGIHLQGSRIAGGLHRTLRRPFYGGSRKVFGAPSNKIGVGSWAISGFLVSWAARLLRINSLITAIGPGAESVKT